MLRCSDAVHGRASRLSLKVRRRGADGLRLDVSGFEAYCDPPPEFEARAVGPRIDVREAPLPKWGARSRCYCAYALRLRLSGVPDRVTEVRLFDRDALVWAGPEGPRPVAVAEVPARP